MNSEELIRYEKDGIRIVVFYEKIAVHKNGLVIEIPMEVLRDFQMNIETWNQKLDKENRELIERLFGSIS